jgi:hypothetical protein
MTIVRLPERSRKTCAHCSKIFSSREPSHRYCIDCWRFGKASQYIANAVALFKAIPK